MVELCLTIRKKMKKSMILLMNSLIMVLIMVSFIKEVTSHQTFLIYLSQNKRQLILIMGVPILTTKNLRKIMLEKAHSLED